MHSLNDLDVRYLSIWEFFKNQIFFDMLVQADLIVISSFEPVFPVSIKQVKHFHLYCMYISIKKTKSP